MKTGNAEVVSGNIEENDVKISVIIATKNESANINLLLDSLQKIIYSKEDFEVIIVDDNSSDNSYELLKYASARISNLSIFKISNADKSGKRNALALGICNSKNPFILITDADCLPNPNWLQNYSKKFKQGYDVLIGPAPFVPEEQLVNRISSFENLRSSILSFSLANIGMPFSAAARNMGFTKTAYEKIGGYKNTFDTLSGDDDLLIREAAKAHLKIGTLNSDKSFVYSKSKSTFKDYLDQRARHTQTSFHYLFKHKLLLGLWHLINLSFLFSPLLAIIDLKFLILLTAKLLVDILIVKINDKKFGYNFKWYKIVYHQIIYELLLIVHFFNAKFRKVKWK